MKLKLMRFRPEILMCTNALVYIFKPQVNLVCFRCSITMQKNNALNKPCCPKSSKIQQRDLGHMNKCLQLGLPLKKTGCASVLLSAA